MLAPARMRGRKPSAGPPSAFHYADAERLRCYQISQLLDCVTPCRHAADADVITPILPPRHIITLPA